MKKEICEVFEKKPFDPERRVLVFTNASKEGALDYILTQKERVQNKETGKFEPQINKKTGEPMLYMVTCRSTSLTPAQRNYSVIELEMSAIVYAFNNAKHWLIGSPQIQVFADHSPL